MSIFTKSYYFICSTNIDIEASQLDVLLKNIMHIHYGLKFVMDFETSDDLSTQAAFLESVIFSVKSILNEDMKNLLELNGPKIFLN